MKGFLSLVIIAAGLFMTWTNREKFIHLFSKSDTEAVETAETTDSPADAPRRSAATPHPAREAQMQATAIYPGLSIPNSALNQKFVALYKEAQASNSPILTHSDWPLTLAERAVVALGGAPMPRTSSPQARAAKSVVIYTTSHCPYCKQAKQYFAQKGVPYREIDIETSLTGNEAYRKLGGNGVPLIMVGDKKVDGFDQKELDRLLL